MPHLFIWIVYTQAYQNLHIGGIYTIDVWRKGCICPFKGFSTVRSEDMAAQHIDEHKMAVELTADVEGGDANGLPEGSRV